MTLIWLNFSERFDGAKADIVMVSTLWAEET